MFDFLFLDSTWLLYNRGDVNIQRDLDQEVNLAFLGFESFFFFFGKPFESVFRPSDVKSVLP